MSRDVQRVFDALWERPCSVPDVAARAGMAVEATRAALERLREAGLAARTEQRLPHDEQIELENEIARQALEGRRASIAAMHNRGVPIAAIAIEVGIHPTDVKRHLREPPYQPRPLPDLERWAIARAATRLRRRTATAPPTPQEHRTPPTDHPTPEGPARMSATTTPTTPEPTSHPTPGWCARARCVGGAAALAPACEQLAFDLEMAA